MEETIEPVKIGEVYRKMEELSEMVNMLRSEISILTNKVDSLERNIASLSVIETKTIPETVIIEEMSKETARQKVLDYMREHKKLAPSTGYHSAIFCNSSFELIPNETTIPTKSTCRQTNFLTERFV